MNNLKQIKVGDMENFCYLISSGKTVALIDPSWEPKRILDLVKNFKKIILIYTHTHFDHTDGIEYLIEKINPLIYVHKEESKIIKKLSNNVIEIKDNDIIEVGEIKIKVIHTPGHTPGSICLYFDGKVLTGDTLFVGACGRTDFPGGNYKQLKESLKKLMQLPDETIVYPGHDYSREKTSTIKKEKETNRFIQ